MRPSETLTDIRFAREAFGRDQELASKFVKQSDGSVNLNPDYYLYGPKVSRERVAEDVKMFGAEHYMMTTGRPLYTDGLDWFHPNGEKYRDFFGRSVEHHKNSQHLVRRFSAEGEGFENAGIIVRKYLESNSELPIIVLASPPGEVYSSNKAFKARNVTFILIPVCERSLKLGDLSEKTYQEYVMYVVPSPETTTEEHLQIVSENADMETTLSMLGMNLDMIRVGDANCVVSLPLILQQGLDQIAVRLNRADFAEIVREAEKMFELEEDPQADLRRQEMNEYFTDKMWGYISRRDSLTAQERLRYKAISDVMHRYMSLEAGMEYVGKTFADIQKDIEGHTLIEYRNTGVNFSVQELKYDLSYAELAYNNFFLRLANNPRAQESYSNSGCPINVNQTLFESRFGGIEAYSQSFGYESTMTDTFANIYTESTTTSGGEKECYQCPMPSCGADVYTKNGDTYCVKGHHKGG